MKNYQKGSALQLTIIIVAILVVAGTIYYYSKNNGSGDMVNGGLFGNNPPATSTDPTKTITTSTKPTGTITKTTTTPTKTTTVVPPTTTVGTKTGINSAINVSQNAADVAAAEAEQIKIAAANKQMGIAEGKYLAITAPSYSNVLEPGKAVTLVFSPVSGASEYEITITKPSSNDQPLGATSGDQVDTLLRETTADTVHNIIVPQTDAFALNEQTYNGEKLIVRALDKDGFVIKNTITQQGKLYEAPAMDEKQIKILPPPSQPQLLRADTYVLPKEGGTITLTFSNIPPQYTSRKVTFLCTEGKESQVSIDGLTCSKTLTLGKSSYIKKMIVQANPYKDRDTAVAVRVQYFDVDGHETNPTGLDDESSVSIKIRK